MSLYEIRNSSHRGYYVADAWDQSMPSNGSSEDTEREGAVRLVDGTLHDAETSVSELLVIRSLLYVVRVSGYDLGDLRRLSRTCAGVTEAIISNRKSLSGRARAAAARHERQARARSA